MLDIIKRFFERREVDYRYTKIQSKFFDGYETVEKYKVYRISNKGKLKEVLETEHEALADFYMESVEEMN